MTTFLSSAFWHALNLRLKEWSPVRVMCHSGIGKESCLAELLSYTEEKSIQIIL